ncbi:MAG: GFA family protein [Pseudomonadota bacterium]
MTSDTNEAGQRTGGCACGAIRYRVTGPLRQIIACHCAQCRRTSGHFVAATACRRQHLELVNDSTLKWFRAIPGYRRGFCQLCGSSLFFEADDEDRCSIAAGSLDDDSGLRIAAHIFCEEQGRYYDIDGDTPRHDAGAHAVPMPD